MNSSVDVPLQSNRLTQLFDRVDRDNDGRVTYMELWEFLKDDFVTFGIPKHVAKKIHERADRNDDSTLVYAEFERLVLEPEHRTVFDKYLNNYMKLLFPQKPSSLYEEQYSCWSPKICMIIISILGIVLFAIDMAKKPSEYQLGPIGTALIYNPRRRKEVWRFLTYMFVHIGVGQILMNVAVQLLLGLPLELVHKWWRVLSIYLFGVLAGSLASSIVAPHSFLAAANSGTYALMATHIAYIIMNWKEMRYSLLQLLIFPVLIILDGSVIYHWYTSNATEHVSYWAHFIGGLGGFLMGMIVLDNIKVRKYQKIIRYVSICCISLFIIAAVVVNVVAESHFPTQEI